MTSKGKCALITAEVRHIGGHVVAGVDPFGWVVLRGTGIGPDILGSFLAVNNEGVEEIMGRNHGRNSCESYKGELHYENNERIVWVL